MSIKEQGYFERVYTTRIKGLHCIIRWRVDLPDESTESMDTLGDVAIALDAGLPDAVKEIRRKLEKEAKK